jgi:hypothetical protein
MQVSKNNALRGLVISLILNSFIALSALFAGLQELSPLTKVADYLAAPPGIIAERMFAPTQHTLNSFVFAMVLSLIFSILFYAAICWAILAGSQRLRLRAAEKPLLP